MEDAGHRDSVDLVRVRHLKRTGKLTEAAEKLERAARVRNGVDRFDLFSEITEVNARLGRFDRASAALEELQRICNADPDNRRRLRVIELQAISAFLKGQFREAGTHARRLYTELQRTGVTSSPLLATVHNVLAGVAWHEGRIADAIGHTQQCARVCNECGDDFTAANTYRNLGVLHFTNGEWNDAIESFRKSDRLCEQTDCVIGRTATLLNLGILETSTGEHESARKHLEECLSSCTERGEYAVRSHAELALAHLDLLQGNVERACGRVDKILSDRDSLSEDALVQASSLKAMIECDRGGVGVGLSLASEARRIAHDASLIESEADSCRALGHAYISSHELPEAERILGEAIALSDQIRDPYRRALALLELSDVYARMARRDEARKRIDEATNVFARLGAKPDLARAQSARARLGH